MRLLKEVSIMPLANPPKAPSLNPQKPLSLRPASADRRMSFIGGVARPSAFLVIIDICNFLSISRCIVEVHLKLEVNRRTGLAPIARIYMHHGAYGFTRN
jgi:hypothetical protein